MNTLTLDFFAMKQGEFNLKLKSSVNYFLRQFKFDIQDNNRAQKTNK